MNGEFEMSSPASFEMWIDLQHRRGEQQQKATVQSRRLLAIRPAGRRKPDLG